MAMSSTFPRLVLFFVLVQVLVIGAFYYHGTFRWNAFSPVSVPNLWDASAPTQVFASNLTNFTSAPNATYKAIIAIGLGLTTRKVRGLSNAKIMKLPFFKSLLPSFCKTASAGYEYRFYLAFDYNDPFLSKADFIADFGKAFARLVQDGCRPSSRRSLHLITCDHTGKPAWAQNDAMVEAYLDGAQYFYRINDDTVMSSAGWTERFIDTLRGFRPALVGVTGPTHKGGNLAIMTYDFTHRTHIDIHGFYYPRAFPDWYADRWITNIYKPGRSVKRHDVRLVHTMEAGQRYRNFRKTGSQVNNQIEHDKANVIRYSKAKEAQFGEPDPTKVISMSLFKADRAHTWGAIRNAQLMPVIYPGWSLYVYTSRSLIQSGSQFQATKSKLISDRIIKTLLFLGAKVIYVDDIVSVKFPPPFWSHLVADQPEVDVFLLRNADERLTERDQQTVKDWLASKQARSVQCIKDHPAHANRTFINGLCGAKADKLRLLLGNTSMRTLIENYAKTRNNTKSFVHLEDALYERVKTDIVFYDSITCDRSHSVRFPVERKGFNYVGQKYDAHEQPLKNDKFEVLNTRNNNCSQPL